MPEAQAASAPEGRVARRRANVRRRILDVAEKLMAKRGADAVTLDEIADAADISRRSFYHYFDSKYDVLVPIARARTKSLNERIDRLVARIDDPAEVIATGMRHGLRGLTSDPLCRWFILNSGLPHQRLYEGMGESGLRDARHGIEAGRLKIDNPEIVRVLMSGAFVAVMRAHVERGLSDNDLDDAVEHLLRLLGVSHNEAREIAHRPLPALPAIVKPIHPGPPSRGGKGRKKKD